MTQRPFSFDYLAGAQENAQPRTYAPAAIAPAPTPSEYSAAAIDNLRAQFAELPTEQQSSMLDQMRVEGRTGTQQIASFLDQALNATPSMMASPVSLEGRIEQGLIDDAKNNGYSTRGASDFELAKALIDSTINPHLGRKSPEEIRQMVATLPIAPEFANAFSEHVERQIKSNENPFGSMIDAALANIATIETASVQDPQKQDYLSNLPKLDFAKREELERNKYLTASGPVPGVRSFAVVDTVSAALDNGNGLLGDLPSQQLPDVRAAMGIAVNNGGRGQG